MTKEQFRSMIDQKQFLHPDVKKMLYSITDAFSDAKAILFGDQTVTGKKTFEDGKLVANEITAPQDFTIKTGPNKTMVLEQYVWRDEYPTILIPAGAAAAPGEANATIGDVLRKIYAFDGGNTEERLSGSFEIPHDMAMHEFALPEIHVHWRPSTNLLGTVKWFFDWEYSPPQAAPIPMDSLEITHEITADNLNWHLLTALGYLPQPSTVFSVGGKIGFNIRRTPADEEDTYAGDVYLEQIAMHVPVDTAGSRQIYAK